MKNLYSFALFLMLFLTIGSIFGEGIEKNIYKLDSITITSTKWQNVTVITAKDIEKSNKKNLEEILSGIAGLNFSRGMKGEISIFIRGIDKSRIKVLIDGVPVNDAYYDTVNIDMLPVEMIQKIEIYKGLSSSKFGVNNLGGVINIISKNAKSNNFSFNSQVTSNLGGKLDTFTSLNIDKFSFILSYTDSFSDGYSLSKKFISVVNEGGGYRENSAYDKKSLLLKTIYNFNDNSRILFSITNINNEQELPYSTTAEKNLSKPYSIYKSPRFWRFPIWLQKNYNIAGNILIRDDLKLNFYANYLKLYNELEMYRDNDFTNIGEKDIFDDHASNFSVSLSGYKFVKFELGFLNENKYHKVMKDNYIFNETTEKEISSNFKNLYIILEKELKHFVFSINLLKNDFENDDYSYDDLNYTFKFKFNLAKNIQFSFLQGKNTHYPNLHQLADALSPDLQPEYSNEYDVYFSFNGKRLKFNIGYYEISLNNLINRDDKMAPYYNMNRAFYHGIESSLELSFGKILNYKTTVSLMEAKNLSKLGTPGDYISDMPYIPDYKITNNISFNFLRRMNASIEFNFYGKSFDYYNYDKNIVPSYSLMNFNVNYNFTFFDIYLRVNNLFDKDYYT
ncbi:TonB-dependent receptor, partial [bacterium]|nr:TonB-dependent receptor [bacterium]